MYALDIALGYAYGANKVRDESCAIKHIVDANTPAFRKRVAGVSAI